MRLRMGSTSRHMLGLVFLPKDYYVYLNLMVFAGGGKVTGQLPIGGGFGEASHPSEEGHRQVCPGGDTGSLHSATVKSQVAELGFSSGFPARMCPKNTE